MKKEVLIAFSLIFLISLASAGTIIHVETVPLHKITVTPIKTSSGFNSLGSPTDGFSNEDGEVRFNIEISSTTYDLYVVIKDIDGEKVGSGRVGKTLVKGEEVTVEFYPEGYVPPVKNETKENETEKNKTIVPTLIVNETNETKEEVKVEEKTGIKGILISGFATVDENKSVVQTVYYSLLILLSLTIAFMFARQHTTSHKLKKAENKVKQIKEDNGSEDDLKAAEEELKRAKEKVDRIMSKKKEILEEKKKKLIEEEKEIIRLRGGKVDEEKSTSSKDLKDKLKE